MSEKTLPLSSGRSLAYADNGDPSSSAVFIMLHGAFGVGDLKLPSDVLSKANIHRIAPTLPGWGNTSPAVLSTSFAHTLASDITSLLNHLHPNDSNLKLYIVGGSYGTIAAQMLYGAPYDIFPFGRYIAGLLLLSPFSPPHCHREYAKSMSWQNYLTIGPPAPHIPFRLLPRLMKLAVQPKVKSLSHAETFIRDTLFNTMNTPELTMFARWRETHGVAEGQLEHDLAENVVRSVASSWEGFYSIGEVLHSGWGGYCPGELDEEHARPPVLIVAAKGDRLTPYALAEYLAAHLKHSRLKTLEGGHIAAIFQMEEILAEFLAIGTSERDMQADRNIWI